MGAGELGSAVECRRLNPKSRLNRCPKAEASKRGIRRSYKLVRLLDFKSDESCGNCFDLWETASDSPSVLTVLSSLVGTGSAEEEPKMVSLLVVVVVVLVVVFIIETVVEIEKEGAGVELLALIVGAGFTMVGSISKRLPVKARSRFTSRSSKSPIEDRTLGPSASTSAVDVFAEMSWSLASRSTFVEDDGMAVVIKMDEPVDTETWKSLLANLVALSNLMVGLILVSVAMLVVVLFSSTARFCLGLLWLDVSGVLGSVESKYKLL